MVTSRRIAAIAVLVLALLGCSDPPNHGQVYDKDHDAAWIEHQLMCGAYSKNGCMVWVPYTIPHPERWLLCLVDDNDEGHRGCLEVPAQTWDRFDVGTHYPDPR